MTDTKEDSKRKLALGAKPGRLELKSSETSQVRQSFPHGRTKTVQVEVRKKRTFAPGQGPVEPVKAAPAGAPVATVAPAEAPAPAAPGATGSKKPAVLKALTEEERAARTRAIQGAIRADVEAKRRDTVEAVRFEDDLRRQQEEESRRKVEETVKAKADAEARAKADEETKKRAEQETQRLAEEESKRRQAAEAKKLGTTGTLTAVATPAEDDDDRPRRPGHHAVPRRPTPGRREEPRRRTGKITVTQALTEEDSLRVRSLAAMKRAREKERLRLLAEGPAAKIVRDVVIPEVITVQELASRMAERSSDVVKSLMKMGVMATINQQIDADTAELVVTEFGHRIKRVTEADVEIGLVRDADDESTLASRAPVVTIMGHVDHGKTSLLDALRETDVAKHEAGGITQHIGAYKVRFTKEGSPASGREIVFLDTPGHEAFTMMRSRGAKVTDVVVLVVAADDGVMPQTLEAVDHARAAAVPIIVAVNKIDKPEANPDRVKKQLADRGLTPDDWGGDTYYVNVSAKKRQNLDGLLEMICLVSDVKGPKATPGRKAVGSVLEAKLDRGRGPVATILVQDGTLKVGDNFIAGSMVGKVRALIDDRGHPTKQAGPSTPVEVLGLTGLPQPGDTFQAVADPAKARQIAHFRQEQAKNKALGAKGGRLTLESLKEQIAEGSVKDLPIIVKADVQGSAEVLADTLQKLSDDKVRIRIIHSGVGAISEFDVLLASASNAIVIGFNVRPDRNAAEVADRESVDVRLHSVIYTVTDEIKLAMTGLLEPTLREQRIGTAEVREIFKVPKIGTIAGCMVTDGRITRSGDAQARLLRDNVVVFEGKISSLRRFKDDVSEVRSGFECGISLDRFNDLKVGDLIEVFVVEKIAATA